MSHVTYTPCTLAPRLPDVCEKNVFRFIRSSASGKQHLLCQSAEIQTYMYKGKGIMKSKMKKLGCSNIFHINFFLGHKFCKIMFFAVSTLQLVVI